MGIRLYVDVLSIHQIFKERKRFLINKEYQRSEIWNRKKKQKLIDSIIKNLSIGMLFIRKKGTKYEVLDGQQRLRAIWDFIDGKFKTSAEFTPEFPNKTFKELKNDKKIFPDFISFKIYCTFVEGGTEEEICDLFLRLQEGIPLNVAEKLNAMRGEMRNFIVEISRHKFFKNLPIKNFRFSHRLYAAQIALLELQTNFQYLIFPDLRFEELKRVYKEYKTSVPKKLKREIKRTLNFLYFSLGKDLVVLRKKSDLPILYILTSFLHKNFVMNEKIKRKFGKIVKEFFAQVYNIELDKKYPSSFKPFVEYAEWSKHGLTQEAFKKRFEILLTHFLEKSPRLVSKSKERGFNVYQKLAIFYLKDRGKCQYCGKEVNWKNACFHHKKFYSRGGKTTISNGQLMHRKCHQKFHELRGGDSREPF